MQTNTHSLYLLIALISFVTFSCSSTETITVRTAPVSFQPTQPSDVAEESEDILNPFAITIGEAESVKSLDPLFALNSASQRAIFLIYEGLTRYNEDGSIEPALASSWSVSDDSLTYTFSIRPDAFFHDDNAFSSGFGRPVNSEDVVYVFNRMASRNVPDNAANMFRLVIQGFDAFYQQSRKTFFSDELLLSKIRGIEAQNENTVSFTLNQPNPDFIHLLAHPFASVYPREVLSRNEYGLHNNPVGTGLFLMSHVSGDSLVTLERNFDYFDQELVTKNLTSIRIRIYRDESTLFRNMASGEINYIPHLGPQTVETILMEDGELLVSYEDSYRLTTLDTNRFYLHYLPENASGFDLSHVSPYLVAVRDNPVLARTQKSFLLQEIPEESDVSISEQFMIGFYPEPFVSHIARRSVSKILDIMDTKLYSVRSTNIDLAFMWTPHHILENTNSQLIAEFTYPRFALTHRSLTGLTYNDHLWWVGLRNVSFYPEFDY